MIDLHHKIRRYQDTRYPLVEAFRKADWVDISLGFIKFGLTSDNVKTIKQVS